MTLRWSMIGWNVSSSCAETFSCVLVVDFCVKHFEIALATVAGSGSCVRTCVWETGKATTWRSRAAERVWIHCRPSLHLLSSAPQTPGWVAAFPGLVPLRRRAAPRHQTITSAALGWRWPGWGRRCSSPGWLRSLATPWIETDPNLPKTRDC